MGTTRRAYINFEKNFLSVFLYGMGMEYSLIRQFCVDSAGGMVKVTDHGIEVLGSTPSTGIFFFYISTFSF